MSAEAVVVMKILSIINMLSFIVFSSVKSWAQVAPPSAKVMNVQIDGSGCDAGSANAVITDDLNFLSVLYDRYTAEIGQGTAQPKAKAAEKHCNIIVDINVPQGWTLSFDQIDYRGFVQVPNKAAAAYQITTADIDGGASAGFDQQIFQGPKTENFTISVKNKIPKVLSTLSCQSNSQNIRVRIKNTIGVRNLLAGFLRPTVKIVVDSTDASFKQNLKINWKRCM